MALVQKLELRQGQSLVMTPQLQQAIKLLQMSSVDLQAYVETELERNPLLERADDQPDDGDRADPGDSRDDTGAASEMSGAGNDDAGAADGRDDDGDGGDDRSLRDATTTAQMLAPDSGWHSVSSGGGRMEDSGGLEALIPNETSLADHLHRQLAITTGDPAERIIGSYLIGSLNDAGYLAASVTQVAEAVGASPAAVERVLGMVQKFDPAGVFARDLRECLAIQLDERNRLDPAMRALLDNLGLVARRDFNTLCNVCGVGSDDLKDMLAELRRLSPKPGAAFGDTVVQPVIPDVIVRMAPDGTWLVELNAESLPRVLVNSRYYATVSRTARTEDEKTFVANCHSTASWLVKSLDQRARTILTVSKEIVRQQDAFLMYGVQHLKPMNLRAVAQAIGMHESTVSRVTSNKYLATPRGIFEMKYFFTTAIAATDNDTVFSAEAVRARLRAMVEAEGDDVLSDDAIVDLLRAEGVVIARRTVAKYRESLGILSSVQRRRERRLYG
jgi:RNA polymerase sigma-54 factor